MNILKNTMKLHPFLFSIFPGVFFFSMNSQEILFQDILVLSSIFVAITFGIILLCGLIIKNKESVGMIISIGFIFFTVATILGAIWAAEAWGGYWSWDPKETWALIVWLNYAAWLHLRLIKGLRGSLLAWWSLAGLAVTTFAFLGVNLFLSGLHSYGEL